MSTMSRLLLHTDRQWAGVVGQLSSVVTGGKKLIGKVFFFTNNHLVVAITRKLQRHNYHVQVVNT